MSRYNPSLIILVFLITSAINAQIISGTATVELNGPASQEQTLEAQELSRKEMKSELVRWLSSSMDIDFDTSSSLKNQLFERFIDSCMFHSQKGSSFKGKSLTLNYHLTTDKAEQLLGTYNSTMEAMSIEAWNNFILANTQERYNDIYKEGFKVLSYASAYLGNSVTVPGIDEKNLLDSCKTILQSFFDRIKITSSHMILQGKAGQILNDAPKITVQIDSTALQGIEFCGILPNGKIYFTAVSDHNGEVSLDDLKIPFVTNGTLLYVSLNPGSIVMKKSGLVKAQDYGILLRNSQDQTFIFKVARSVYTLDYSAVSVSNIKIPSEYSSDSYLHNFLRDSCFMQKASGSVPPDLVITVKSQVSKYDYDETERTAIKFSNRFTIKGLSTNPPKTEQMQSTFEKQYEQNITIPFGLLFWEANAHLRENIKKAISQL